MSRFPFSCIIRHFISFSFYGVVSGQWCTSNCLESFSISLHANDLAICKRLYHSIFVFVHSKRVRAINLNFTILNSMFVRLVPTHKVNNKNWPSQVGSHRESKTKSSQFQFSATNLNEWMELCVVVWPHIPILSVDSIHFMICIHDPMHTHTHHERSGLVAQRLRQSHQCSV